MPTFQNLDQLRDFIESHFERRAQVLALVRSEGEMEFALYDTFVFKTSIDPQTKVFGFGLELAGNRVTKTLLGERFSLNNDEASITTTLQLAERFCRLSLPDKILEVYDNLQP